MPKANFNLLHVLTERDDMNTIRKYLSPLENARNLPSAAIANTQPKIDELINTAVSRGAINMIIALREKGFLGSKNMSNYVLDSAKNGNFGNMLKAMENLTPAELDSVARDIDELVGGANYMIYTSKARASYALLAATCEPIAERLKAIQGQEYKAMLNDVKAVLGTNMLANAIKSDPDIVAAFAKELHKSSEISLSPDPQALWKDILDVAIKTDNVSSINLALDKLDLNKNEIGQVEKALNPETRNLVPKLNKTPAPEFNQPNRNEPNINRPSLSMK